MISDWGGQEKTILINNENSWYGFVRNLEKSLTKFS